MSHFRLLREPESYTVQDWDLVGDAQGREYWLSHFASHMEQVLAAAMVRYGPTAKGRTARVRQDFQRKLDQLREKPDSLEHGMLRIVDLCRIRDRLLRQHNLPDPFGHIKQRENAAAVELYQDLIAKLDGMENEDRWLHLVECIFAGNIFDLGCKATMKYANDGVDFLQVVQTLPKRPWLLDHYDALQRALPINDVAAWSKAVIFVDNAGADFVLGVMPLARALALHSVKIVLAANELPSLNDITVNETIEMVNQLAAMDRDLGDLVEAGMFEVASTGNDMPLIDLSDVSDELNEAAAGADLVILEGMGRSVESNFDTPLTCDALRLCMLKDEAIAARIGGKLFDVVCKYTPAQ